MHPRGWGDLTTHATLERRSAKEAPITAAEEKGRAGWARSEEVLEGALLDAVDLLRRLGAARLMVAELESTIFADAYNAGFVLQTIYDAQQHIRSCQWCVES